jgi:NhaA family Na+:H+ antiporter
MSMSRGRLFVRGRIVDAARSFVQIEASGGIVLLLAALAALVWANSPWSDEYVELWHTAISVDLGIVEVSEDLRHWVNDGLMTIFFFLMGLEIKRETVHGELSSPRRAVLPIAAAAGGMAVPAAIYVALNAGGEGARGWGIPMATDIAFALGVLSLLNNRVPFSLKIFLLGLAVADDIGAIIVIAVFYSASLDPEALGIAALLFSLIVGLKRNGYRNIDVYVWLGALLWLAVLQSGIHATLAGVALGLLTPAREHYSPMNFAGAAQEIIGQFNRAHASGNRDEQQGILAQMEDLSQGTESPLDRLERKLHPWVSYGIVPVFALANAGVVISGEAVSDAFSSPVSQGVALGLLLGKPIGIVLASFLVYGLRLGELPRGATWARSVVSVCWPASASQCRC